MQDYQIREVDWQEAQHELKRVREEVFIVEQNVPVELEWDGLDPDARHVLAQTAAARPWARRTCSPMASGEFMDAGIPHVRMVLYL